MKPKNKILAAQERYLKTGDQEALVQMYEGLKAVGLTIQANEEKVSKDPEAVLDIVGTVILRLMENQEEVIHSAPSAYMKTALFYLNKTMFHDSIEDHADYVPDEPSAGSYEAYVESLTDGVLTSPESEEAQLVKATLTGQVNWHQVHKCLTDKTLRREYRARMNEVKEYAKNHMQGNRLLQTGGPVNRAQVLHRASESGEG